MGVEPASWNQAERPRLWTYHDAEGVQASGVAGDPGLFLREQSAGAGQTVCAFAGDVPRFEDCGSASFGIPEVVSGGAEAGGGPDPRFGSEDCFCRPGLSATGSLHLRDEHAAFDAHAGRGRRLRLPRWSVGGAACSIAAVWFAMALSVGTGTGTALAALSVHEQPIRRVVSCPVAS